jgi:LPXTG-motif cell wall-anchored protein
LVVGFDGLTVKNVQGCSAIEKGKLPEGSNSGFACPIDDLAAGASKSYDVDATFDLSKTGKICLPVQSGDGKKTFWQQGPVPFGTTNPSPNAPATPLLLGTDNQPVAPGGDELPKTGVGRDVLPLGAAGAALMAAGAAGLWWSQRRPERQEA